MNLKPTFDGLSSVLGLQWVLNELLIGCKSVCRISVSGSKLVFNGLNDVVDFH